MKTVKLCIDCSILDMSIVYDIIKPFTHPGFFSIVYVILSNRDIVSLERQKSLEDFITRESNLAVVFNTNTTSDFVIADHTVYVKSIASCSVRHKKSDWIVEMTITETLKSYRFSDRYKLLSELLSDRFIFTKATIIRKKSNTKAYDYRVDTIYSIDDIIYMTDKLEKVNHHSLSLYASVKEVDNHISANLKHRDNTHALIVLDNDDKTLLVNPNNHSYYIHCDDNIITSNTLLSILNIMINNTYSN